MVSSKLVTAAIFLVAASFVLSFQSLCSTTLIDAVQAGDYNKVESLLKSGVDVNEQGANGMTAIWAATDRARWGMKIFELILQYKPNIDKLVFGQTPLMIAIGLHNWKVAELLLVHNPDLNQKSDAGDTALMLAYNIAMAYDIAEGGSGGKQREEALKIVNLLSAKMTNPTMTNPKKINIPEKSCFLSFERNDWNGVIAQDLNISIENNIISIVVPQLLKELFKKYQRRQKDVEAGKITVLASRFKLADKSPQLIVIVPVPLDQLGIKIPESEKQNVEPKVDISSIENEFGFKNLTLVNPASVADLVEKTSEINPDEFKKVLDNFPEIINSSLPQHPTRFFLVGHGNKEIIGTIPMYLVGDFLYMLSKIGTEFIYIVSCYAGANLPEIQTALANIITKQIEERKKSKTASLPGIDFAIVIQATSDVPTIGVGDTKKMFIKLDKFLQDPAWALEFGPGVEKPQITISDVISAYRLQDVSALPSIRMPGKTGYFRSINIKSSVMGDTEIITESKLIEEGAKRTLELIAESKSPNPVIADEAKKKLKGNLDIAIHIKPETGFIQIFPMDLMDFTFVIQGVPPKSPFDTLKAPKFISKLSGRGQHYIGKIVDTSHGDIKQLINQSFGNIFVEGLGYMADRCWFIKFVDIPTSKTHIKKLAIHLYYSIPSGKQLYGYAFINEKNEYIISEMGRYESKVGKNNFELMMNKWFRLTKPSQVTLTEATGGVEVIAEEKARLEKEKGGAQALKLIEPKFARTPEDLFKMFMAE